MNRLRAATLLLLLAAAAQAGENRVSFRHDVHVDRGETVDTAASLMGSVVVDGEVKESATSLFGDVTIGPTGQVGGDAMSIGGSVYRVEGSTLTGKARSVRAPGGGLAKLLLLGLPTAAATLAIVGTVVAIASSVGFVVLVALILILFERQVLFARSFMEAAPFRALSLGFLAFLALLPLLVFLTVTIIGIPLAVAAGAVAMAAICLGAVAACEWLGREVARGLGKSLTTLWRGLLGLAALFLVGFVPVVGAIVHVAAVFIGLGAVAQSRFRSGDR